jgi:ubiquinone biosynthesis protein
MLRAELIPTRLMSAFERPKVVIEEARRPARFRGLLLLYRLAVLGAITLWLRVTRRMSPTQYARSVRTILLELGTVWVKLGQVLAMRSDLLPAEFAAELATLREVGTGVPFAKVRQAVEQELGAPLERHFDEFSEMPFVATMSFQLHRARLKREQVWVVVKVLHPYAEEMSARDLALLRRVTGWLQYLGIGPKMCWLEMCREVEEVCVRDLDLRFESSSLAHLQQTLPAHGIYVPHVFAEYCTRRVLVMEFIHAALMADYIELKRSDPERLAVWLEENNIQPSKVARRLFDSVWRQILEDNFFHADMHPENVILLRDSRLAVIDCRSVGRLEAECFAKHQRFIAALADGDYSTAADYSFLLASRLPQVDLGEVKAELVRVWRRWEARNYVRELPTAEKSLTQMLDSLNRTLYKHQLESQWSLARLMWTLVNADSSIMHLACGVNYVLWLRRYFRAAQRRRKRIKRREVADRAVITLAGLLQLPQTFLADSIAQQEVLRRQARVYQASTRKSSYFLATVYSFLAAGLLLLGGLLTCAYLTQHQGAQLEPVLGPQLTGLVRAVPELNGWRWVVVLLGVLYFQRRMVWLRRGYLGHDIVRPGARPAI